METTLYFNDKIIFLSDISYIERRITTHKKKEKDSAGLRFPETTYDIIIYLRSSNRNIITWYPTVELRDEHYKKLIDLFTSDKSKQWIESLFGKKDEKII